MALIVDDNYTKFGSNYEIPFLIYFHKVPLNFGLLQSNGTKVGQSG